MRGGRIMDNDALLHKTQEDLERYKKAYHLLMDALDDTKSFDYEARVELDTNLKRLNL